MINKFLRKKAVSPVIAAVLLIGLVVVAGAALSFIVLPFFSTTSSLLIVEDSTTLGYGTGTVSVFNDKTGLAKVTLVSLEAYISGNWTSVTLNTIDPSPSVDNTVDVKAATKVDFDVTFTVPEQNNDSSLNYRYRVVYGSKDVYSEEKTLEPLNPHVIFQLEIHHSVKSEQFP